VLLLYRNSMVVVTVMGWKVFLKNFKNFLFLFLF